MSNTKFCHNCGAPIEEGIKFCPQCGADVTQTDTTSTLPPDQPYSGTPRGGEKRALDHVTIGYNVALEQPMVFLPTVISGVLGAITSYLLYNIGLGDTASTLIGLIISMVSFILNFASIDMSRDAYYKQPLDLMNSISYVVSRFFIFLIAAIVGGILSITIILIPVVLFMFVIMVMDETGIMDAFSKAINVLKADLGDVLLIIVISIVASIVISYVPFVSTFLSAAVNVILGIAYIDIYATFSSRGINPY